MVEAFKWWQYRDGISKIGPIEESGSEARESITCESGYYNQAKATIETK